MAFELIDFSKFPSMPSMFSTAEPGEAWIWNDFVLTLQIRPRTIAETMAMVMKERYEGPPPMGYPYALTALYRKDKNPHGFPSGRPVAVATLEKADYKAMIAYQGGLDNELLRSVAEGPSPIVRGLFIGSSRFNLGSIGETVTLDEARRMLFSEMRRALDLTGEPHKIGTVEDVFGHPETGWPAKEKPKGKGCLLFLAGLASLGGGFCCLLLNLLSH